MVCTLGYGLASSLLNSNTSDICLMNLMTVSLQNSQHFLGPVTVHCTPTQEIQNSNTFIIPTECSHHFSCWQCILNFFFYSGCRVALFHQLPLGFKSKWWAHISSHVKICGRKPSTSVSYQHKWPVLIPFLTSLCTSVSMHGTKQVQTSEHLSHVHQCESQSKWWLMKWYHTTTPKMKRIKSVLSVG